MRRSVALSPDSKLVASGLGYVLSLRFRGSDGHLSHFFDWRSPKSVDFRMAQSTTRRLFFAQIAPDRNVPHNSQSDQSGAWNPAAGTKKAPDPGLRLTFSVRQVLQRPAHSDLSPCKIEALVTVDIQILSIANLPEFRCHATVQPVGHWQMQPKPWG